MKYYTSTTEYNCGIDLHARQMYVCVMDRQGKILVHTNVKDNDFQFFLKLVKPYRHSLTVCCECMFGWYWLADACQAAGLTFVLAHALYVKAIHGGKNKNEQLQRQTKKVACREYALLQTVPGIGETLGLIVLHEIGDIHRFPSVKDLIWSIRPSGKSAKNWNRTPVGNDR